ncbi:hypothetical protein DIPPA_52536 [Diplonema papillatum]|nr:hypothetical protein DIPPA_52536 [Diplonema papillatum]
MKEDPALKAVQGLWRDEKGTQWLVEDDEVKMKRLGSDSWDKTYKLQLAKKTILLNGSKLQSSNNGIIEWKTPLFGSTRWTTSETNDDSLSDGNNDSTKNNDTTNQDNSSGEEGIGDTLECVQEDPVEQEEQIIGIFQQEKEEYEKHAMHKVGSAPKKPKYSSSRYRPRYSYYNNNDSSDEEEDDGKALYPLSDLSQESLQFTPMRLAHEERKDLRVLVAAIKGSQYIDVVDASAAMDADTRQKKKLRELRNLILGMHCATASTCLAEGAEACRSRDLSTAITTAKRLIEIGRRYKISSPNTFEEYGKLLYIAQDCFIGLGDDWGEPATVITAADKAKELNLGAILADKRIPLATTPVPRLPCIDDLNKSLRKKSRTVKKLLREYSTSSTRDAMEQLIYSIDDRNVYIMQNATPISEIIGLLKKFFSPEKPTEMNNLAITEGEEGSRLTHRHEKQYYFVLQSLSFWKNILKDMSYLWVLMEQDMLSGDSDFRDTGQGSNRVQQCPNLFRAVTDILNKTKKEVTAWVGSERIHMGDNQVPNGLHFIDKYTQVSRIILPILNTLKGVERVCAEDPGQATAIDEQWGSVRGLQMAILRDFFRLGFDGSGGFNDDDAGSCIDGRLTSAWNWCSLIRTKPFYPAFLLSGFSSFDVRN